MKNNLPEGWEWTSIGKICFTASGGTPRRNKPEYYNGKIPWLKSGELNDSIIYTAQESITDLGLNNSSAKIFKKGDILIALYGATVGKLGILGKPVSTNQAICSIRTPITLENKYVFWFLKYKRKFLLKKRIGGAQPNISQQIIRNTELPFPPPSEQHRIVVKIEELFTKLDAGVEALKQAQAQLKRYRQSVLKAAVEGRLTKEWREKHLPASPCSAQASKDELEPADKLLERILKERREKWKSDQLVKYEVQGKTPPKNWLEKYKEPTPPDTTNLPELPIMWSWVTIGQISILISGQHIITKNYNQKCNGLPYLTGPADFGTKFPITSKWTEFPKAISIKDDVLITVKGAGVGKTNILNLDESAISRQLMAIRSQHIRPDFIFYYLKLKFDYFQRIGQGSTVPGIDRENILNTPIPYPPFSEQSQITIEIDRTLSIIEESESIIKSELKRAQSLRQSILKRAFDGKLVPQDPNDLHASVLLERIKTEKANNKKSTQMEIQ